MQKLDKKKFVLGHGLLGSLQIPLLIVVGLAAIAVIDKFPVWPGMLVCAFGEAIQVWSASHLVKNEQLINSGPYAYVRNPMYLGRFFVGLGFAIMIKNPWLIAAYVALFAVYAVLRVGGEEARLADHYGDQYAEYCAAVRRFLPRFTRYAKSSRAKAKWESFTRNHEYRNVIGLALAFALIYARLLYFESFHISSLF